jgi:hypothetical protein
VAAPNPNAPRWVFLLESILGHYSTRIVLSIAIIVSLLPTEWMHGADVLFLFIFVPEFVALLLLSCRKEAGGGDEVGWRVPSLSSAALLLIDFVALLSFLPYAGDGTRWLRLFRLTRTVMLLRYWAPLLSDVWLVVRRRERSRQLSLLVLALILGVFAGTVFLNHATRDIGDDFDGDGDVGDEHDHVFWVRMYWGLRQLADPGNMINSPHETATVMVSMGLTIFGVVLASILVGIGADAVGELMSLSNLRSSGLKRHTVLVNLSSQTRQLVTEVQHEYQKLIPDELRPFTPRWFFELRRNAKRKRDFVVVGRSPEPPDFLREPELGGIMYRENSDDDDEAFMDRADVMLAHRVVIMADTEADQPDDDSVRTLITIVERLREHADEDPDARTQLIAEILDESNIGAAQRAIARAQGRVEAHIVPSERLLALFSFMVARRRGAEKLVTELMQSPGHEIYSWDYRQSEGTRGKVPAMPSPAADAFEALYWRGLSRPPSRRVLPVGILLSDPDRHARDDARVALNPTRDMAALEDEETFAGFLGLALNLRVAMEFADEVLADPSAAPVPIPEGEFTMPTIGSEVSNALQKVLICGFRPSMVNLIEAIITVEPRAQVLVLVEDLQARADALDAFDAHTNLVETKLLDGLRGTFSLKPGTDELQCSPGDGRPAGGRIVVEVGDWTSSRQLMELPRELGTAVDMDLVMMVSSKRHGSDATTATALMKLEHLQGHLSGDHSKQTVIAELINADLAHRLSRRYAAMGRDNVAVFSIHELRAFFMFQSMIVPNFNLIYGELLAPWGQSFVKLHASGGVGTCTFTQLAGKLRMEGRIPIAIEVGGKLFIAQGDPEQNDQVELARLTAIWVIRTERPNQPSAAHPVVPAGPASAPKVPPLPKKKAGVPPPPTA